MSFVEMAVTAAGEEAAVLPVFKIDLIGIGDIPVMLGDYCTMWEKANGFHLNLVQDLLFPGRLRELFRMKDLESKADISFIRNDTVIDYFQCEWDIP